MKRKVHFDCPPDVVHDLLGLVMDTPPPLQTVQSWTPQQRLDAEEWAAREHLAASDMPIRRVPRPEFIS